MKLCRGIVSVAPLALGFWGCGPRPGPEPVVEPGVEPGVAGPEVGATTEAPPSARPSSLREPHIAGHRPTVHAALDVALLDERHAVVAADASGVIV